MYRISWNRDVPPSIPPFWYAEIEYIGIPWRLRGHFSGRTSSSNAAGFEDTAIYMPSAL